MVIVALSLRGIFFEFVLLQLGYSQTSNYVFRSLASVTGIGVGLFTFSYLFGVAQTRQQRIARLEIDSHNLQLAIVALNERVLTGQDETASRIEGILNEEMTNMVRSAPGRTVSALQEFLGSVVRPMSHQLAGEIYQWKPESPAQEPVSRRIRWYELWRQVRPEDAFRPMVVTPAMVAVSSPGLLIYDAYTVGLIIGMEVLLFPPSIIAMRWLAQRTISDMSDRKRAFELTLGMIVASFPTLLAAYSVLNSASNLLFFTRAGLVHLPVSMWLLALARVAALNSRELESELDATRAQMKWTVARINVVAWFQRGEASRVLHGPVQTAIQSSLFRIRDKIQAQPESNVDDLAQVEIERLHKVINGLGLQRLPKSTLQEEFDDIVAAWDGISSITIACDDDVLRTLEQDVPCATLAIDVVGEGCVNAIRHGKAALISVSLRIDSDELVIVCTDNGLGLNQEGHVDVEDTTQNRVNQSGLGTRLLENCATSWSRSSDAGHTVLEARFPLLHDTSQKRIDNLV